MKETKFKLTAPFDESGKTIKLSVTLENWFTLKIEHQPDHTLPLIGFVVSVGFSILFLFLPQLIFLSLIPLVYTAYLLVTKRSINCIINKQNGRFYYFRGGILGSRLDQLNIQRSISEIKKVEMIRYYSRGLDGFQIALSMSKWSRLYLTSGNLSFSECKEFTDKISDFLGPEIPVEAMDW